MKRKVDQDFAEVDDAWQQGSTSTGTASDILFALYKHDCKPWNTGILAGKTTPKCHLPSPLDSFLSIPVQAYQFPLAETCLLSTRDCKIDANRKTSAQALLRVRTIFASRKSGLLPRKLPTPQIDKMGPLYGDVGVKKGKGPGLKVMMRSIICASLYYMQKKWMTNDTFKYQRSQLMMPCTVDLYLRLGTPSLSGYNIA